MNEASSSTTFSQELADIIEDENLKLCSNELRVEPEMYNYLQQPDHRSNGVPLQCPLMINYQSAGVNNNQTPVNLQQRFSPTILDWRSDQQSFQKIENPKKRLSNARGENVVNKKLVQMDRMQECIRERVPMRRSQKLADRITALQKLVSPYGKTDTASVLQEAYISINLLHAQIKSLVQNTQTGSINDGWLQFQDNKEAERSLRDKGLCLVPMSSPQIYRLENFISMNY